MNKFIKDFCKRGLMFAAGGPIITAIVWMCLEKFGHVSTLTVNEAVIAIISTSFLAFIAAGISIIHQIESIPKPFAALIQASVLYIDYLGIYLLNGWMKVEKILIFTLCFFVGFAIIWMSIYIPNKIKVDKMNRMLSEGNN